MRFTSYLLAISTLPALIGCAPVPIEDAPDVHDFHVGVETNATKGIDGEIPLHTQTIVTTVTSIQIPLPSISDMDGPVKFLPPGSIPTSPSVAPTTAPSVMPDAAALFFPADSPVTSLLGPSSIGISPSVSVPLPAETKISNLAENTTVPLNTTESIVPSPSAPVPAPSVSASSSSVVSSPSSISMPAPIPMPSQSQVMAYYPDWAGQNFPPEKIDFTKFDWIDFAFALPNSQFALEWDDSGAPQLLERLVTTAHASGKKVKLSIGGWTGAKWFSPAVSNAANRAIFVNNIVNTYNEFNLDGIDIDWEYPGQSGQEGNIWSRDDTANYYLFLALLRSQLPPTARISAATQVVPFADQNGEPLKNVTPFVSVLDWVLIMNYDIWGSDSNPGPNAPLSNACGNSTQPDASADSAIAAWTAAGMPANKIVLGVPSYGYISHSTATKLRTRAELVLDGPEITADLTGTPSVSIKSGSSNDVVLQNDDGSSDNGQLQFSQLVAQGALDASSFHGAGGFTRYWDECSSTPYLTSPGAQQVITYDDPQSLELKAGLAKQRGLLGVNMFDVHGDTDNWDLTNAVRKGLGVDL